jgi:hypothetical protein
MKWLTLTALLLVGGCATPTEPADKIASAEYGQELIPQMTNAAGATGHFSMSCSRVGASTQCFLLWVGASATTTVSIAECAGTLGLGCAAGVLSTMYTWQQFYAEPDCYACNDPFGDMWHGQWYRDDRYNNTTGDIAK